MTTGPNPRFSGGAVPPEKAPEDESPQGPAAPGESFSPPAPMAQLGQLRIRLDTVRLYGLLQEDRWRLKVYERDTSPPRTWREWLFPERRWRWQGKTAQASGPEDWQGQQLVLEEGQIHRAAQGRPGQPEDLLHQKEELLYLVTDQGETFRFYAGQAPFDLWEKCRELDEYLLPGREKKDQCL